MKVRFLPDLFFCFFRAVFIDFKMGISLFGSDFRTSRSGSAVKVFAAE